MEVSLLLMEQIAQLFIVLLMGYIVVKAKLLKPSDSKVLSVVFVYLIMPCVVLNAFQIDDTPEIRAGLLYSMAIAVGMHVVFLAFDTVIRRPLKLDAVERVNIIYSNAAALVIPLVQALLGSEYVVVESIIKCRRNRYGFSCIIFLSEGRRKEVKTLNGYSYLTLEQRREIERMYAEGERVVDIAARLKRSAAAIYEELKRGYTGEFDGYARPKYSADLAQATVQENFRRRGNRRGANC